MRRSVPITVGMVGVLALGVLGVPPGSFVANAGAHVVGFAGGSCTQVKKHQIGFVHSSAASLTVVHGSAKAKKAKKNMALFKGDRLSAKVSHGASVELCDGSGVYLHGGAQATLSSQAKIVVGHGEVAAEVHAGTAHSLVSSTGQASSGDALFDVSVHGQKSTFVDATGAVQVRDKHGSVSLQPNQETVTTLSAAPQKPKTVDAQGLLAWTAPLAVAPAPTPTPTPTSTPVPHHFSVEQPNPVHVTAHADSSHSSSSTIGPSGGSVSATDSHGTTYTLTVPHGSVGANTKVTLTPLLSVDNLPFSGGLGAGVQIDPDGLVLWKPATLTMAPAQPIPLSSQISFDFHAVGNAQLASPLLRARQRSSQTSGPELGMYPLKPDLGTITFQLSHFSGYGIGVGTPTDVQNVLTKDPPTSPGDQAMQDLSSLVTQYRQASKPTDANFQAQVTQDMQDYYTLVVLPALDAAAAAGQSGDAATEAANLGTAVEWRDMAGMLGIASAQPFADDINHIVTSQTPDLMASYTHVLSGQTVVLAATSDSDLTGTGLHIVIGDDQGATNPCPSEANSCSWSVSQTASGASVKRTYTAWVADTTGKRVGPESAPQAITWNPPFAAVFVGAAPKRVYSGATITLTAEVSASLSGQPDHIVISDAQGGAYNCPQEQNPCSLPITDTATGANKVRTFTTWVADAGGNKVGPVSDPLQLTWVPLPTSFTGLKVFWNFTCKANNSNSHCNQANYQDILSVTGQNCNPAQNVWNLHIVITNVPDGVLFTGDETATLDPTGSTNFQLHSDPIYTWTDNTTGTTTQTWFANPSLTYTLGMPSAQPTMNLHVGLNPNPTMITPGGDYTYTVTTEPVDTSVAPTAGTCP